VLTTGLQAIAVQVSGGTDRWEDVFSESARVLFTALQPDPLSPSRFSASPPPPTYVQRTRALSAVQPVPGVVDWCTMNSFSTGIDLSTVRSTQVDGTHWFSLTDIATALGCDNDDPELLGAYMDTTENHRSIRTLYRPDGTEELLPVITLEGLARLCLSSPPAVFSEFAVSVLLSALPAHVSPQARSAVSASRAATRWGEQPVRALMRGMGMSVAQLAVLLGRVPGREAVSVRVSTLNSVLMGRNLPSAEFFARVRFVFQRPAQDLFSWQVLAAVAERDGVRQAAPAPAPAPSVSAAALVREFGPVSAVPGQVPLPDPDADTDLSPLADVSSDSDGFVSLPEFSEVDEDAVYAEAFGAGLGFLTEESPSSD
jgi:prophage antirepressor-like protein